jgi:membrane protein
METAARFSHALRLGWRAAGRGVIEFYHSSNLTFAASIAYYALLSLFPFVLLTLSIVSRLALNDADNTLLQIVARVLPSHFDFVSTQIEDMAHAPFTLGVVSTIVMVWAAMGVFNAITSAVNHAWGVETPLGFLKQRLIAFLMLVVAALLLVTTLALISAVQFAQATWFAGVLAHIPAAATLTTVVYRNAPTPMFILVVGLIYYFAPNAHVRLRDVWFGAILAGLLWRLIFAGFSWYVRDLSRFSIDGSAGAVVAFLVWIYLQAVVLLYGVEVTAAYARLRQHLPKQVAAAPQIEAV